MKKNAITSIVVRVRASGVGDGSGPRYQHSEVHRIGIWWGENGCIPAGSVGYEHDTRSFTIPPAVRETCDEAACGRQGVDRGGGCTHQRTKPPFFRLGVSSNAFTDGAESRGLRETSISDTTPSHHHPASSIHVKHRVYNLLSCPRNFPGKTLRRAISP